MLLLKESQIEFQDVINPDAEKPTAIIGLFYQNKLFKKLKSFPKDKLESAEKLTRQLSIDPTVVCLIIEGTDGYTIWCQDSKLKLYTAQVDRSSDRISQIDLKELVREMRDIGGVKIKDRRYRLTVYPRCMVGSEITTWLVRKFFISEAEAVKIGQKLIDEKLLHHVTDAHLFQDDFLFYRFYWDE
jgi:hypothetical protein